MKILCFGKTLDQRCFSGVDVDGGYVGLEEKEPENIQNQLKNRKLEIEPVAVVIVRIKLHIIMLMMGNLMDIGLK